MRKPISVTLILFAIFLFLFSGCTSKNGDSILPSSSTNTSLSQEEPVITSSAMDGKTLFESRCTSCHSLARAQSKSATADQWKVTVDRMIGHGAVLTVEEETVLIQYLAENFK